jgi:hypothetical protein
MIMMVLKIIITKIQLIYCVTIAIEPIIFFYDTVVSCTLAKHDSVVKMRAQGDAIGATDAL